MGTTRNIIPGILTTCLRHIFSASRMSAKFAYFWMDPIIDVKSVLLGACNLIQLAQPFHEKFHKHTQFRQGHILVR
jgi:hypothetical protein